MLVRKRSGLHTILACGILALLMACGQDPSFLDRESGFGRGEGGTGGSVDDGGVVVDGNGNEVGPDGAPSGDATVGVEGAGDDYVGDIDDGDEEVLLPGGSADDWMPDWVDGDSDDPTADDGNGNGNGSGGGDAGGADGSDPIDPGDYVVPAADPDDLDALHKCLAQWKNVPFNKQINNYRRIYASVNIGASGAVINDTESTDDPYLILVDAGVNVFGTPSYNLLNKNGYYCMKVNVNVQTDLTINLHCNARLADSRVNVNVGSTQNDSTSAIGVHVLSNVDVNTVRPSGDECAR